MKSGIPCHQQLAVGQKRRENTAFSGGMFTGRSTRSFNDPKQ